MIDVEQSDEFKAWLKALRDAKGRAAILVRIARMEDGNFGDVGPVGAGVSEMRVHVGPGYRAYFVKRGDTYVLLLCGGDKSTQARDIARAKVLAKEV